MEKLNSYVLNSIFEFLSEADLKSAFLVCKSWNSLIASSTKLSRKFHYYINGRTFFGSFAERYRAEEFPYRNFIIKNLKRPVSINMDAIEEILTFHKENIENLVIKKCKALLLQDFLPISSNLTHLTLVHIEGNLPEDFKIDLPNLEFLRMDFSSKFVDHIKSHKLKTLDMYGSDFEGNWKDFLATCKDLEVLSLQGDFYEFYEIGNFPFNIKKLTARISERLIGGFKRFCTQQKESLKTLILIEYNETHNIFDFVAFDLELTELYFILGVQGNLDGKKVNKTIKKFKVNLENFSDYSLKVLSSLQVVENLTIHFNLKDAEKITNQIAAFMPNLQNLTIFVKDLNNQDEKKVVKIPQVKNLSVNLSNEDIGFFGGHWAKYKIQCQKMFYNLCPNVEKIEILEDYLPITADVLKTLLQSNPNLQEIFCNENLKFNDDEVVDLLLNSKVRRITIEKYGEKTQKIPKKIKKSKIHFFVRQKEYEKDEFMDINESDDETDDESEDDDSDDDDNDVLFENEDDFNHFINDGFHPINFLDLMGIL